MVLEWTRWWNDVCVYQFPVSVVVLIVLDLFIRSLHPYRTLSVITPVHPHRPLRDTLNMLEISGAEGDHSAALILFQHKVCTIYLVGRRIRKSCCKIGLNLAYSWRRFVHPYPVRPSRKEKGFGFHCSYLL